MLGKIGLWGLALVAAVAVGGCAAPSPSPPSRYYILSPLDAAQVEKPSSAAQKEISLGVGPVNIPPHLDRSQIVGHASPHKLNLAKLDQWAEPLKDNLTRVLAENLSLLMASDKVETYPWHRSIDVDYQVVVDIIRFDANREQENVLIARWKAFGNDGRKFLFSRRAQFIKKIPGEGFESVARTMSENLADLSREIAAELLAYQP